MATREEMLAAEDRITRAYRAYLRLVAHGLPSDDDAAFFFHQPADRLLLSMSLEVAEALADKLDKLEGVR